MISLEPGGWAYHSEAQETVRVLNIRRLWERDSAEVLGSNGAPVWVPADRLTDPGKRSWTTDEMAWRAAAAKAAHLMAHGEPVAIALGNLEPLPHQLAVLDRALAVDPVRLLLADEVGLGKTIEAGMVYSELKARGRVNRVLVVAPKGVQLQWIAEMRDRFEEEFALVGPSGIPIDAGIDPWQSFDRVVCSIDSVKPLRPGPGIDPEEVQRRNELRYERLVSAQWDLVVIDEAHHAAGATIGVARHELGKALAERTRHLLLLSATPHSGKADAFARLMSLIDHSFLDGTPVNASTIAPYVVRNGKRSVVDQKGDPLFQPRTTSLEEVQYKGRQVERQLYDAATDYIRQGYKSATSNRAGSGTVLLMLLMQRLASSSTAALLDALERRMASLVFEGQLRFFPEGAESWGDLTGEEQVELLESAKGAAWGSERAELEILIELAKRTLSDGPDSKARHLLELISALQREESDPSIKLVVFTQFVATQKMLLELLETVGIAAVSINGSMDLEERRIAQNEFQRNARVLVSTDAGGEGINLQFAHVVVNYDLPWNPMRIEQRIGRVDRIGQNHPVKAFNLVLENSIDKRVLEIFERKLDLIMAQLGVDKRDDVLQTISSANSLEGLVATAISNPERLEEKADELEVSAKQALEAEESVRSLLRVESPASPRSSDADEWAGRAVAGYEAWSDRSVDGIAELFNRSPQAPATEAVPVVTGAVEGVWSLWEVSPDGARRLRDFVALFVVPDGSPRPDLADRLWTQLAEGGVEILRTAVLTDDQRLMIESMAADYAYRACQGLQPEGDWIAPVVTPRLVVRVV